MSEANVVNTVDVASFVYMRPDEEGAGVRYFMPEAPLPTVQVSDARLRDHEVARWLINTSPIRPTRSEHVSRAGWDGVVVQARVV